MNKILYFLTLFIIISISCNRKSNSDLTRAGILANAVEKITSHNFVGTKIGKIKYQDTIGGPLYVDNINGYDTLSFDKYGTTVDSNITLIETGGQFEMKLCDSNFQNEYLVFSYRSLSNTEILPPNLLYDNHYCSLSGSGPEAEIIYYYNQDSLIYFRNFSINLYDSPWNVHPYNNWYLISFTKKE